MRLHRYDGSIPPLPRAPGWPHRDTAAGLSFAEHGGWTWLIVDDDGRIAGECGVKGPPDDAGQVEIGYGLAGGSRGQGLGSAAVRAMLAELERFGVRRVVASVAVDNLPSRRLLERLGFALEHADPAEIRYWLGLSSPPEVG